MNIRFKVMFIVVLVLLALWSIYPIEKKINLGLDLRGGIDLIYEVDTEELFKNMLTNKVEQLKQSLEKNNVVGATFKSEENGSAFSITVAETGKDNLMRADTSLVVASPAVIVKNGNNWRLTIDREKAKQSTSDAAAKAVEIIRNRIDQLGVKEPLTSTMGEDRIRIQLPGEKDIQRAIDLIGSTAQLQFRLMKRIAASYNDKIDEATEEILPGVKEGPTSETIPLYVLDKAVLLTGDYLVDARPAFDEAQRICVSMEFNAEGAKKFAEITTQNLHKNIAIVLDGKVQTAPQVQSVIPNGRAQITGSFTDEVVQRYAIILRAGSLPAPIRKASATLVGPTLGNDSIHKGVVSSVFGAALVFVFMIFYYKFCGLIASFALTLNTLFTFAIMALLGSTLTLPGIAGLALTLGVAVDANVLIFERIKEELRAGKTVRSAIEAGFDRAFTAIWDSNLTTLISALALYYYGTGPIKGFAVTLSSGLIISMFTAIFVVKVILDLIFTGRKVKTISI